MPDDDEPRSHTASQKELDAADLARKLEELQHSRWLFEMKYGEQWSGLFDGPFELPARRLLQHCKVLTDRLDIIRELPKGGNFAEVGTFQGDFIVKVLEANEPAEVHIFDIDFSNLRRENRARLEAHGNVSFHLGDSSSQLAAFGAGGGNAFDVIYIDADHTFHGVWKDLTAALPLLKPDGYLVCNDYTTWDQVSVFPYGVFAAVNRFANENELAFTHLALEYLGYHDVALRRLG